MDQETKNFSWTYRIQETKGKTQERMERGSRKRSSSSGTEKMERLGDR